MFNINTNTVEFFYVSTTSEDNGQKRQITILFKNYQKLSSRLMEQKNSQIVIVRFYSSIVFDNKLK